MRDFFKTPIDFMNTVILGLNYFLAAFTLQDINLVVAIFGTLMSLLANADKVVMSLLNVWDILRNRLQSSFQKNKAK